MSQELLYLICGMILPYLDSNIYTRLPRSQFFFQCNAGSQILFARGPRETDRKQVTHLFQETSSVSIGLKPTVNRELYILA
jgi:hypothetical protein